MKLVLAVVFLPTLAFAGARATIAKDGAARFQVSRPLEGHRPVKVDLHLPAAWRVEPHNSSGSAMFTPRASKTGRPNIDVYIPFDDTAAKIPEKLAAMAPDKPVPGGGKRVRVFTDQKKLELGEHVHAVMSSFEVDATAERSVHYVETTCLVWRDDDSFIVLVDGFAQIEDAALVPVFEKTCESVSLPSK